MSTVTGQHADNLKKMIDGALARGLFGNTDAVEAVMYSFRHLKEYALELERLNSTAASKEKVLQMPT